MELLRSAQPDEGSWISLAFDPQGRIFVSLEGTAQGDQRGILRLTPATNADAVSRCEHVDDTLQECRGLLYAFDSLYARCNKASPGRPAGLYRLQDSDGDDRFDEVRLLRAERGGGHGVNDLVLGPDDRLYLIQGDESGLPDDWNSTDSRVKHYAYDQLFDELGGHQPPVFDRPPPGYLVRTDAEGKSWEVLCAGLRNPYGIDFNPSGEAFTYEADMESHIGFPFYRPTHVIHLVPGVDYGWRSGTRPWPLYYPERPPVNLTIGLGSPTAVKFGTRSNFPEKYRRRRSSWTGPTAGSWRFIWSRRGPAIAASKKTFWMAGRSMWWIWTLAPMERCTSSPAAVKPNPACTACATQDARSRFKTRPRSRARNRLGPTRGRCAAGWRRCKRVSSPRRWISPGLTLAARILGSVSRRGWPWRPSLSAAGKTVRWRSQSLRRPSPRYWHWCVAPGRIARKRVRPAERVCLDIAG